jgi:2-polyprenyl-6-methoxyphenol hydroxylase-like FAD-dependent oxidoreductase
VLHRLVGTHDRAAEIAAMMTPTISTRSAPPSGFPRRDRACRCALQLSALAQHRHSFVAPRLALVGDAAHGVHPIAGQGLNLGLRDVAALAEVLTDAQRRGEDIAAPDVLARYQTWRRFDTAAMAVATDAFNRLFSNDNPLLRPRAMRGWAWCRPHPRSAGASSARRRASRATCHACCRACAL